MTRFEVRHTLARCLQRGARPRLSLPDPWCTIAQGWITKRPTKDYLALAAIIDWILDGLPNPDDKGYEKPWLKFNPASEESPGLRLFEAFLEFGRFDVAGAPPHEGQEFFALLAYGLDNQSEHSIGALNIAPLNLGELADEFEQADQSTYRQYTLLAVEAVSLGYVIQNMDRVTRHHRSRKGLEGAMKCHAQTENVKEELLSFRNERKERQDMKPLQLVNAFMANGHGIDGFKDNKAVARAFREYLKRQANPGE